MVVLAEENQVGFLFRFITHIIKFILKMHIILVITIYVILISNSSELDDIPDWVGGIAFSLAQCRCLDLLSLPN